MVFLLSGFLGRLREVERLVVLVALAGASIDHVGDAFALLFDAAAVDLNEFVDCEEATSDTDHDRFFL